MTQGWNDQERIAYTERDGPGRPPGAGPSWIWYSAAATLGVVFSVIFFTDSLCPEHRVWVQSLAAVAMVGVVASITGLLRGWASAPMLTTVTALVGAAIGFIDMVHSPLRGGIVAGGFVLAVLLGVLLSARQVPLLRWDRRLRGTGEPYGRADEPEPVSEPAVVEAEVPEPAPELVLDEVDTDPLG